MSTPAHVQLFLVQGQLDLARAESQLLQARYDELRRLAADVIRTIREGGEVRFGSCPWCGEAWLRPEGDPDRIRELAAEHDDVCAQNPLRIERDALRDALAKARAQIDEALSRKATP